MKTTKINSFLALVAIVMFSLQTKAQTYGLSLNNTQVSIANYLDLTTIPGVSGEQAIYNPFSKVLTLKNVTITCDGFYFGLVNHTCDNLIVQLEGTNTITSKQASIVIYKNTVFIGSGTLITKATEYNGMEIRDNSRATFQGNCNVEIESVEGYGIYGDSSPGYGTGYLFVQDNSKLTVRSKLFCISNMGNVWMLNNHRVLSPEGAEWNPEEDAICDASGNKIKGKVVIGKHYGFYLNDVEVTAENADDLTVIPGVSGDMVTYDAASNSLILKNVTFDIGLYHSLYNDDCDNLKVILLGTNSITSDYYPLVLWKNTTITGNGTLNATSRQTGAMNISRDATVTVKGCKLHCLNEGDITGDNVACINAAENGYLVVDDAYLTAQAYGIGGSIAGLADLTLKNGAEILSPAGAVWNSSKHAVCDASGNIIKEKVVIGKNYGLYLNGVAVTSENAEDLTVIPGVSGDVVSYDPVNNDLTLKNAKLISDKPNVLWNKSCGDLMVVLSGTNTMDLDLYESTYTTMNIWANTTFTGDGTLNVSCVDNGAMYITYAATASFTGGCTVNCVSNGSGSAPCIYSDYNQGFVEVGNATLTAVGYGRSIAELTGLRLVDSAKIYQPTGAVWNDEKHAVCDAAGNIITKKVVISYDSGVSICGKEVNYTNASDLTVIDGVSGEKVSYNPASKTLTLKNANMESNQRCINFTSDYGDYTILVEGVNTLKSTGSGGSSGIWNGDNNYLLITGPGTLKTSGSGSGIYQYFRGGVHIKDCTVEAIGLPDINENAKGLGGYSAINREEFVIENAFVTATSNGAGSGSICQIGELELIGVKILSPAGAVWNDEKHAVCDADGNIIKDKVVIGAKNPYDLNDDGKVSTADIQVIINEMKKPQASQNMMYDLNADGKISTADIQVIINEMKK